MSEESLQALEKLESVEAVPFERTTHPDAQWFPDAGFGLFVHWGIHSVAGIEPSWAMMKNCPFQQDFYEVLGWSQYLGRDAYYALASRFDPESYDPDEWLRAAAEAGVTYAVLTTKHHDGYALWPSEYGELNTRQHLGGGDLVEPYVAACRRYGLKIGFYYSPPDWGYPGFPVSLDRDQAWAFPPDWTPAQNLEAFEAYYRYLTGQLSELLTRYGEVDLLWFDGMGWPDIEDIRTEQTLAWVRELQPHIVINPRWGGTGDFETVEGSEPAAAPEGWWEHCVSWCGHWGHSPHAAFMSDEWVIAKLVRVKAGGGNLLLNVGPAGDGTMRPEYYEGLSHIARWRERCGESLSGACGVRNWQEFSNVPVTRREGIWYLHGLPSHEGPLVLEGVPEPKAIESLNHGVSITWWEHDAEVRKLTVRVSMTMRDELDNVFRLTWDGGEPEA